MTKKSESRLLRDATIRLQGRPITKFSERLQADGTRSNKAEAYYADNTCWDDVQTLAVQCASLLPQYVGVGAAVGDPRIQHALENPQRLVNNVRVLTRDLTDLNAELQAIRADHVGRTGAATSAEDHMAALGIHERYLAFVERHNALLTPTFMSICEDIQTAEIKVNAALGSDQFSKDLTQDVKEVLGRVDAHLASQPENQLSAAQDPNVLSEATIVG